MTCVAAGSVGWAGIVAKLRPRSILVTSRPRPKSIPGIHLGQLGWFMAVLCNRLVPGIEKYHEFNYQISLFQQKDQEISGGHVT